MAGAKPLIVTAAPAVLGVRKRWQQIKSHFGPDVFRYWPLHETAGTVAKDFSQTADHGTYVGADVTLAGVDSPVEGKSLIFGGTDGHVNVCSADFIANFPYAEGSLSFWVKLTAPQWADGAFRYVFDFRVDDNNTINAQKVADGLWCVHVAGGVNKSLSNVTAPMTDWVHICFTWSKVNNRCRMFQMGTQMYAEQTGPGNFVGNFDPTYTALGAYGPYFFMAGNLSDFLILKREITPDEVTFLVNQSHLAIKRLAILGDSIAVEWNSWTHYYARAYNHGLCRMINHSVMGTGILQYTGLAGQVAAAAKDNADTIILAFGTNDDNAGSMATLQAALDAGITALRAANPKAALYYLNVLPRWTDNTGATPVDKSNIRAAIAATCAARSVTCWDSYTTPWITAAQTADGIHPTTGSPLIAAQVLSRLP